MLKSKNLDNPHLGIAGGHSGGRPMRIGVWNFYEELTTDGFLFKNTNAAIGHNLLKPWCDLYAYGQAHGMHFVTLDQVTGPEELDAVIFMDRPRMDSPMVARLLNADIAKYLCLYETEIIKPDNWDAEFHKRFDRLFTWSDRHVDHSRYIKINSAIDPEPAYDFEALKAAFHQRKLCTLIAGAKAAQHPNELYSERLRAIHWFQVNAPQDFDLYGFGWNPVVFPSYIGAVDDKLATLARYRFAICYENARNYPGYITEKILDCFRAGVVPVYLGAPNIDQWIPPDCYIDRNDFTNEQALYAYLSAMDAETHGAYVDRIRDLLASPKIYPFTTECFITTLTSLLARDVKARRGESPDVTVTIPAYNYGKYLRQAVESALSQNITNLEVLVFDNASTDATQEVLVEFAGDARLRYMTNTRNIGGAHNWNNAFQAAAGRYITVLSADDFFLPGHLARMLQTMDAQPSVSLAYCPCIWVDEAGNQLQVLNHRGHAEGDYVGGRNEVAELLACDSYITPSAALIRRSAFDLVGRLDDSLRGGIDWDLWIRMAEKTPDFAFFKTPLVCYRIHAGQDTVTQVSQAFTLIDHIDILWNALERGSLSRFQTRSAEILALLKFKFNAHPPALVGHLQAQVDAIEKILTTPQALDIRAERQKAKQSNVSGSETASALAPARSMGADPAAVQYSLVSVIVPTCNRPELLDRCLRSICAQNYLNVEIIVVNDAGCSVEHVITKNNTRGNIRYISHEVNKGASAARNSGLQQALGDYIAYLDDDDEYLPEHLSLILDSLGKSNARFAYSRAEYLIENDDGIEPQVQRQRPFSTIDYSRDLLMIGNFIPTPTWVFERSLLTDVGYFDESFKAWEDWEWLIRASQATEFLSIPHITVEVHQRSNDGGHLGVIHRPEMRKWFELVYAKHPAQTPEMVKARADHMNRLFPDHHAVIKPADMDSEPDIFLTAKQGQLDIISLVNNAERLVNAQRSDLAAELYRQWMEHTKSPLIYAAAFNLGVVLEGVGKQAQAEDAYRYALACNPQFANAHFALALLLQRCDKPDQAQNHWRWIAGKENGVQASHPGIFEQALANLEGAVE